MKYNAEVFFLYLKYRPKTLPFIDIKGRYWHTGIIYKNKVYETFSKGKYKISNIEKYDLSKAKIVSVFIKDPIKLKKYLKDGLPCDNYVNKVLGYKLTKKDNEVKVNFK